MQRKQDSMEFRFKQELDILLISSLETALTREMMAMVEAYSTEPDSFSKSLMLSQQFTLLLELE